jgi:hypothetical protein
VKDGSRRLRGFELSELLLKYPGLRVKPTRDGTMLLHGSLDFTAVSSGHPDITDTYEITILVPKGYPEELPIVNETAGRIPPDFHKLADDALCLGAPLRLRMLVHREPSLLNFIERVVIPYLYGRSSHERGQGMPFGELSHGTPGLIDDLAEMLGSSDTEVTGKYLQAIRKKKRVANKFPCPCGSGLRLGRCHNRRVNGLRLAIAGYSLRRRIN